MASGILLTIIDGYILKVFPFSFLFNEAGKHRQSVATGVLPEYQILDTENKDVAARAAKACFVPE